MPSSSACHSSSTLRGDSITEPTSGAGRNAYCSQSSLDQCTGSSAISPWPVTIRYGRSSPISDETYRSPCSATRAAVSQLASHSAAPVPGHRDALVLEHPQRPHEVGPLLLRGERGGRPVRVGAVGHLVPGRDDPRGEAGPLLGHPARHEERG